MFSFFNVGLSSNMPVKNVKIKIHEFNGVRYISGLEFAKAQNIRTIFYEDKEKLELEIISGYLPEQLSESEVQDIIADVIAKVGAAGPADMGKVMGAVMPKVRGRADGKIINSIVTSKLKDL